MTGEPRNVVPLPDPEAIEHEAGAWVARMDGRALSISERAELSAWMKRSALHRQALERMAAVWGGCDVLDEMHRIDPLDPHAPEGWLKRHGRPLVGGVLAAGIAVVCAGVLLLVNGFFSPMQTARFVTAVGEQKTIALAEGSTVILNTDSEISVNFARRARDVALVRGQAHFEVAEDSRRAFSVFARDGVVKAVGTAFSVYLRDDDVEVTVTEGVVELLTRTEPAVEDGPASGDGQAPPLISLAALTANENAVFDDQVEHVEMLSTSAVERKLLWRDGMIGFAGEPLSVVVAEVSRYTEIEIEIDDDALGATPIGGFFAVGDVENLFDALQTMFDIDVERVGASHVKLVRRS